MDVLVALTEQQHLRQMTRSASHPLLPARKKLQETQEAQIDDQSTSHH